MKLIGLTFFSILVQGALTAGTIDVTTQNSAFLNPGDTLIFGLLDYSFAQHAAAFGISPNPTAFSFQFATYPLDPNAQFAADLESPDGSISVAFASPIVPVTGVFQGSAYHGTVSTLEGSLVLSPALSQALFQNSQAVLVLRDLKPAVTLGLSSYTLQQDLTTSFFGGGLSTGGAERFVLLDPPDSVPEPASGTLLAEVVLLSLLGLGLRRRFTPLHPNPSQQAESIVCNPHGVSDTIEKADRILSFEVPPIQPTE